MRRFVSVVLFSLIAVISFWGILKYAKTQEDIKRQSLVNIETVKVYTDLQSNILEEIGDAFYAETGLQLEVIHVNKNQIIHHDINDSVQADIFLTSQNTLSQLKKTGRLKNYSSAFTDTALDLFKDADGAWTGIWVDPVVFVVNKDFMEKHPLFNYNWTEVMVSSQVRLTFTDFIAAEMAEDVLMSLVEHFGLSESFYLLNQAKPHIVQYGKYLSTPARMTGMGKCDVGISSYNEAIRAQKDNLPIRVLYPTDGAPWYLYGVGLSVNSKNPERGKKLIDWLLTPAKYKRIMQNNNYYTVYVNDFRVDPDINGSELMYWGLEKNYIEEGKKVLLDQWMDKIRFGRNS